MKLLLVVALGAASGDVLDSFGAAGQCGNTSSVCPRPEDCCALPVNYSPSKFGCLVDVGDLATRSANCGDGLGNSSQFCCKMGPALPPSKTLKNVLIIGDSVSIGYTSYASPNVPELLSDVALAQHGPWDVSDGGAGTTGNGVACLDNCRTCRSAS